MEKDFLGYCKNCDEEYYDDKKLKHSYKNGWETVQCKECGEEFCRVSMEYLYKTDEPYHERLNKNFEVKGICRADLIDAIGEKKAIETDDCDIKRIAELMGDYLQEDYWNSLDEALDKLEIKPYWQE